MRGEDQLQLALCIVVILCSFVIVERLRTMPGDGIDCGDAVDLLESFVLAPARDPRRVQAILLQVAARHDVGRIQRNRLLDLGFHFLGIGKAAVAIRLAAVLAPKPVVVKRILGVERNRFFALRDGAIPVANFVVCAPEPVEKLTARRIPGNRGLQGGNCGRVIPRVHLPLRRLNRGRRVRAQRARRSEQPGAQNSRRACCDALPATNHQLFSSARTSIPSRNALAPGSPTATRSPSLSPETTSYLYVLATPTEMSRRWTLSSPKRKTKC